MNHYRRISLFCISMLLCALAHAGELAWLQNGFSIQHERREVLGNVTRLYLDGSANSGYVDIPTAQIVAYEHNDAPAVATTADEKTPISMQERVAEISSKQGIDPDFIQSVIKAESGFNPKAVSRKGAQGLMQLMPATAALLGVQNSFDPQANIEAGTRYMRQLLEQYHGDAVKALAAYNAGPERVAQYRGIPPYRETYAYVTRVIKDFNQKKMAQASQNSRSMSAHKHAPAFRQTSAKASTVLSNTRATEPLPAAN